MTDHFTVKLGEELTIYYPNMISYQISFSFELVEEGRFPIDDLSDFRWDLDGDGELQMVN